MLIHNLFYTNRLGFYGPVNFYAFQVFLYIYVEQEHLINQSLDNVSKFNESRSL